MKTQELDTKARRLAGTFLQTEGELLGVLMEMKKYNSFRELGFAGVYEYCEQALRLSSAQCYYFKTVAEKSLQVPALKTAVQEGILSLSQARRIAPVITQLNQEEWITKAQTLPQRELEKQVTARNPKAQIKERLKLNELRVPVSDETEQHIKTLTDILSQKLKRPASLQDVIAWMAKEMNKKHNPEQKARRCTSLGKVVPKPGRHKISKSVQHAVVRREGFQCTVVGPDGRRCTQKRWLQFHHLTEVQDGGLNTPENLTLLCSGHHQDLHHRRGMTNFSIRGRVPW